MEQAKRYKELEKENQLLKRLVVDLSLDNSMLKEVAWENVYNESFNSKPRHECLNSKKLAPRVQILSATHLCAFERQVNL